MFGLGADGHSLFAFADAIDHACFRIQLRTGLVEVGDLQVGAVPQAAAIGFELGEQQAQQGSLANAVRADQADAVAAHDAQTEIAHDGLAFIREA